MDFISGTAEATFASKADESSSLRISIRATVCGANN